MNLLGIKAKLAGVGTLIIAAILAVIRIKWLANQRDSLKDKAETLEAQIKQRQLVDEADSEIDQKFSRRAQEAKRVIDDGGIPDHLRDPND